MASIWGGDSPSVAWNENSWASNTLTITPTGQSATSSVGEVSAFPEQGWGRQQYGNSGWGVEYSVLPTGVSATTSVGAVEASQIITAELTGVSAASSVGSLTLDLTTVVTPTGVQAQTELGSFDNAGTLVGWGRNGWGEEPYGDSFNKLVQLSGLSATASVGAVTPADVVGLTGQLATSSVGSFNLEFSYVPSGQSATASVGAIVPAIGVPLTGVSATASVGAIAPADVMGLTGVEATASVGSIEVTETQLIIIGSDGVTTPAILTSAVGSIVSGIGVLLTAPSAVTASVGAIAPADVVGLTGVEATAEIGTTGFGTLAYKDIDITGITSYTDVTHVA